MAREFGAMTFANSKARWETSEKSVGTSMRSNATAANFMVAISSFLVELLKDAFRISEPAQPELGSAIRE